MNGKCCRTVATQQAFLSVVKIVGSVEEIALLESISYVYDVYHTAKLSSTGS